MGFLGLGNKATSQFASGLSLNLLHSQECSVCPVNHRPGLCNAKAKPTGTKEPLIYVLGDAPTKEDDEKGLNLSSDPVIRRYWSKSSREDTRWSSVIRCAPPLLKGKLREPLPIEMEACRPSIERDIEATRPEAIFGFGNAALRWAIGEAGIMKWTGRRLPIKVGSHTCWFYPLIAPQQVRDKRLAFENRIGRKLELPPGRYATEDEFAFHLHLDRALEDVKAGLPQAVVHDREYALKGLEVVIGANGEDDLNQVAAWLDKCRNEPHCGFDLETPKLRPMGSARMLSFAVAGPNCSLGVALDHRDAMWSPDQRRKLDRILDDFIYKGGPKRRLVSHHLAFELEWMASNYGDELLWNVKWTCSEGQAYVLDERTYTTSLDFLCRQHFGLSVKEIDNLDRKNMENCRVEDVCRYNALDAKYHRLLSRIQEPQIIEQGLGDVYHHQIERTIAVVPTQLNGVPIDPKVNDELYDKYCDELDAIEDQLAEDPAIIKFKRLAGHDFRPSAHQDVRFLLTTVLRTADVANTNKKTLAKVKSNVIRLLEKWRKADKVISTYLLPVRKGSPHLYKGRIHPIISTTKTRTWRTASEDPNAQNWPKRTEGVVVRRQLRPGGDLRVVAFDFAGIQARNVAMESNDETLVESFWNRYDIHTDWMERINRKCPGWIPKGADKDKLKALRNVAKNGFVFPSFFGARAKKLSTELSIDIEDAEELRTEFFDLFHDIHLWHEELHRHYYEKGFVTGLSGFIRRAPITPNEMINAPIQADESLIVLEAMVDLSKLQDPRFQPALEIHDDLTFIWPKHEIEKNTEVVIREMLRIRHDWINCPLAVERSIGEDWMSLKGAGEFFSDKLGYGPKR